VIGCNVLFGGLGVFLSWWFGTLKEKPSTTPHKHIAQVIPYWLASCPTTIHGDVLRYFHTFIIKEHSTREAATTRHKFPCVDKWLSNTQINQKLFNYLWKDESVTDAQLTQTLKFRSAQYVHGQPYEKYILPPPHTQTQTQTAHCATTMIETHGPTSYQLVKIHTSKD
jgi:hypothetical protein